MYPIMFFVCFLFFSLKAKGSSLKKKGNFFTSLSRPEFMALSLYALPKLHNEI